MRFRIRRNRGIHPLASPDGHVPFRLPRDDDDWNLVRPSSSTPPPPPPMPAAPPAHLEIAMTTLPPPAPMVNGFRAQATAGDVRAERLVREVRMELADLKHEVAGWNEDRDEMVALDLDSIRANPEVAATLPPTALVRALVLSADRIAELERTIVSEEREKATLRDRLTSLHDEHSYTRGRLETLHEVIGALHSNLEDLRGDRGRRRSMDGPARPAVLPPPGSDEFGMRDQRGSFTP